MINVIDGRARHEPQCGVWDAQCHSDEKVQHGGNVEVKQQHCLRELLQAWLIAVSPLARHQ